ncbi:MAG: purine-binding chemotaxis protein CheW [Bdellovibrionaceae bacterium]|nr:purine-binding chemotaxis protein CheW [Pseudobdellovibrionaceae bacterium]MBX3033859.1 purine-binding chemotaxis protein CheW [Pseudobdellovibrionaceae bacterium]
MNDLNRYLCLELGGESFAIPLLSVREVIARPDTTPVPQMPSAFLGIINLRGQVLSVLDLRLKLSIKPKDSEESAVIILDLEGYRMGVLVDRVNSVLPMNPEEISANPMEHATGKTQHITGVFRHDEKLILLLDVWKALSGEERATVTQQQAKKAA